ncbi:hypothetical protein F4810DRAFT_680039 [Camillea tinctor]|nr:hypothetical protein F4810DRAFT_680039 [Camillea tinctor]
MSRLIDALPTPKEVREKKVIVLSRSRVGTFSLYQAFRILGYKPYHMYESVMNGRQHMGIFEEALRCKYQGVGKPYGKPEFDKWLAEYDCVIEIPQFFIQEFIEFYPDAKFILTERSVESWVKSLENTVGPMLQMTRSFPTYEFMRVLSLGTTVSRVKTLLNMEITDSYYHHSDCCTMGG